MERFSHSQFREQFPILQRKVHDKPLIYFDNAATSQKPNVVINAMEHYYQKKNANVHRASHALSTESTLAFEMSRERVRAFLNAASVEEIIWTKGTTESINLVANSWGLSMLSAGDEIIVSYAEHHANIVAWQIAAEKCGAIIKVLPLTANGCIDVEQLDNLLSSRTKLVAISHISNVIGKINDIKTVINKSHDVGALVLVDGAQAVAHRAIDVKALDCDFYVFSGHKMYGPTGVGCLYGKQHILAKMPPYQAGGEMIDKVSFSGTTYNKLPFKFEAGTPNISGVIGMGSAIQFIGSQKSKNAYEQSLLDYCYEQLSAIESLSFLVEGKPDIPIFSFTLKGHHNHDVATYLDACGIAVRSGHHCAMPLMEYLSVSGCIRISLAGYNTIEEIDFMVKSLSSFIDKKPELTIEIAYEDKSVEIVELFNQAKSWDGKHRQIMLLGKQLSRLPDDKKSNDTEINGCESKAWLDYHIDENGLFTFYADSDAKIIRGLLYIVIAKYQHLTGSEICAVDIEDYFSTLGLLQHLSPSRGNGLKAIVEKIRLSASNAFSDK